jgi:hypothetical protein
VDGSQTQRVGIFPIEGAIEPSHDPRFYTTARDAIR